jgi:hypothetical protein
MVSLPAALTNRHSSRGVLAVLCMVALWLFRVGTYIFCLYLAYLTSYLAILLTFSFHSSAN